MIDIDTGIVQKLGRIPAHSFISSINSDETRVVGKYIDGNYPDFTDYELAEWKADGNAL